MSAEPTAYLIRGALVYDGSGADPARMDLRVTGGRVHRAPEGLSQDPAVRQIDAGGLAVAPGFIDVHTHSDALALVPDADEALGLAPVRQGVTVEIAGNCGSSLFPPAQPGTDAEDLAAFTQTLFGDRVQPLEGMDDFARRHLAGRPQEPHRHPRRALEPARRGDGVRGPSAEPRRARQDVRPARDRPPRRCRRPVVRPDLPTGHVRRQPRARRAGPGHRAARPSLRDPPPRRDEQRRRGPGRSHRRRARRWCRTPRLAPQDRRPSGTRPHRLHPGHHGRRTSGGPRRHLRRLPVHRQQHAPARHVSPVGERRWHPRPPGAVAVGPRGEGCRAAVHRRGSTPLGEHRRQRGMGPHRRRHRTGTPRRRGSIHRSARRRERARTPSTTPPTCCSRSGPTSP